MVFNISRTRQRTLSAVVVIIAAIHLSPMNGITKPFLDRDILGISVTLILAILLGLVGIGLARQEI